MAAAGTLSLWGQVLSSPAGLHDLRVSHQDSLTLFGDGEGVLVSFNSLISSVDLLSQNTHLPSISSQVQEIQGPSEMNYGLKVRSLWDTGVVDGDPARTGTWSGGWACDCNPLLLCHLGPAYRAYLKVLSTSFWFPANLKYIICPIFPFECLFLNEA